MGRGRHGWLNDDLDDAERGGAGEVDDDEATEDEIAVRALSAWLDIEGDDDFSMAQREALAAIAEAVMVAKAEREDLEQRRREERQARPATIASIERREAVRQRVDRRAEYALAANRRVGVAANAARLDEAPQAARPPQVSSPEATHPDAARPKSGRRQAGRTRSPEQQRRIPQALDRRPASTSIRRTQASPPKALSSLPGPAGPSTSLPAREVREREGVELASIAAAPQPDPPALVGADLAAWRARLGLTQTSAADRLGVGQGTVSKAESRPKAELGPVLQKALANALGWTRRSS